MKNPYVEAKSLAELCKILGIPKSRAARIEVRRDLIIAIRDKIEAEDLTHAEAAKTAEVGRTVITAIMNGNLSKISTDRLIDIADKIGLHIGIKVA